MSKLVLYLLVLILSVLALAADYRHSPTVDRHLLDDWRSQRSSACAPCGAPCRE